MADRKLTLRDLNRATLARQMLLKRESFTTIPAAVERLIGLQAQQASAPYVGLWTRLENFQRADLAALIEQREIVKATAMRATLHLMTAADYLRLRGVLQPALTFAQQSILKGRDAVFDVDEVLKMARTFLLEAPRTFAEITAMFEEQMPGVDVGSLRYTVRTHLPLIQVPVSKNWSYPGNPQFTLADTWLGQAVPLEGDGVTGGTDFRTLMRRYLAAFGPASVNDLQTWSGLIKLKDAVNTLKSDFQMVRDAIGHELLDLPESDLPDGDTPAPERFLPEFDNLLLSHKDRTRVIADEYRKRVYLPGLRVAATILVDGFVSGVWKTEKAKGTAALVITPFIVLSGASRTALTDEGERLIRFIEPDAKTFAVRFED